MDQEQYLQRVLRALPELEQEEKELPGTKGLFTADIRRMHTEGWDISDAIRYCRYNESVNCWCQEEDGTWRHRTEEEMYSEDVACTMMAAISKKYHHRR